MPKKPEADFLPETGGLRQLAREERDWVNALAEARRRRFLGASTSMVDVDADAEVDRADGVTAGADRKGG